MVLQAPMSARSGTSRTVHRAQQRPPTLTHILSASAPRHAPDRAAVVRRRDLCVLAEPLRVGQVWPPVPQDLLDVELVDGGIPARVRPGSKGGRTTTRPHRRAVASPARMSLFFDVRKLYNDHVSPTLAGQGTLVFSRRAGLWSSLCADLLAETDSSVRALYSSSSASAIIHRPTSKCISRCVRVTRGTNSASRFFHSCVSWATSCQCAWCPAARGPVALRELCTALVVHCHHASRHMAVLAMRSLGTVGYRTARPWRSPD